MCATCSCITEGQVVLIANHTQYMIDQGLMKVTDYNYPIRQFYRYKQQATLRGAQKEGKMVVEFAVVLRESGVCSGTQVRSGRRLDAPRVLLCAWWGALMR